MEIILLYLLFQKPDIFKTYCKYYSFNFIYKKFKNHFKKLIIVIKYICHNDNNCSSCITYDFREF